MKKKMLTSIQIKEVHFSFAAKSRDQLQGVGNIRVPLVPEENEDVCQLAWFGAANCCQTTTTLKISLYELKRTEQSRKTGQKVVTPFQAFCEDMALAQVAERLQGVVKLNEYAIHLSAINKVGIRRLEKAVEFLQVA